MGELLDEFLEFLPTEDAAADVAALSRAAPARWAVYLFADVDDRPIQLLCVKNLRASLKRRLGGGELLPAAASASSPAGPDVPAVAAALSKRVDYRQIVRRVRWRRVDSAFEADLAYLEAARRWFPASYQALSGVRPAWFVHVDPDGPLPRYVKTADLSTAGGEPFGPLPDKAAAGRLVEHLEDLFDLCRYHDILAKAPAGRACAYKEMGRCPAPCDGSVSMEQYRLQVAYSTTALRDPADFIRQHEGRMRRAAADLKFESAGRIKAYVDALSAVLGKGDFRYVRPIRDFRLLSLQRGPTARSAKAFLVTPSVVERVATLDGEPESASPVLREALSRAEAAPARPTDLAAVERLGVVAHHLFLPKRQGVFVPLERLDDRTFVRAYAELQRQKQPADALPAGGDAGNDADGGGDEGVLKQLQAG